MCNFPFVSQNFVEIEDFRRARPDAIAHSAAKIISRLKAGGEKTTQALKSLCWRCKGIQVEVTDKTSSLSPHNTPTQKIK